MKKETFIAAKPVWEKNMLLEKNHSLVFSAEIAGAAPALLRIAAHSRYQIFINGEFFAAGPARAGHGFFRVDEYTPGFTRENNTVSIITAGYNVNSFYLTEQPPFLCAEFSRDGAVIAATGMNISARRYTERIQKIQRYSFQRPFAEAYDFSRVSSAEAELEECEAKRFIARTSPYCEYRKISAARVTSAGTVSRAILPKKFKDRSYLNVGDKTKGFTPDELEICSVNEAYTYKSKLNASACADAENAEIPENGTAVFDMGLITTGYIDLSFESENGGELFAVINEMLPENGVPDPGRDGCSNVVKFTFDKGGEHHFISFEPYDYKYIQLIFTGTAARVHRVGQIRETFPESELTGLKKMPDEELQLIYDAAKESFVQNATDIFMDCPGRERAGWLCDSFFTSRVERSLTGKSRVEKDFLENFLMPESFDYIPEGMLPMCYPSDHTDGVYIHNWAMWFVLQLKEYFERTGDRELVDSAKERVFALLDFTKKYENEKGLLQKLESWIFVEWSEANDYVLDINYPTNMLYSMVLDAAAQLYSAPELGEKAKRLRKVIVEESFDGEFFRDNSVLDKNGVPVITNNRSETCQYYAFFSGTADEERFPELFEKLIEKFGPDRDEKTYPDIPRSNAFIGNYLRLELLYRRGMNDRLLKEIRAFFLPMAKATGTLWENMSSRASCNHGFASHVAYWLNNIL